MTPTDEELIREELEKLKKVCRQLKISVKELDFALPDGSLHKLKELISKEEKVSLIY